MYTFSEAERKICYIELDSGDKISSWPGRQVTCLRHWKCIFYSS